jgi:hypothetical protein
MILQLSRAIVAQAERLPISRAGQRPASAGTAELALRPPCSSLHPFLAPLARSAKRCWYIQDYPNHHREPTGDKQHRRHVGVQDGIEKHNHSSPEGPN